MSSTDSEFKLLESLASNTCQQTKDIRTIKLPAGCILLLLQGLTHGEGSSCSFKYHTVSLGQRVASRKPGFPSSGSGFDRTHS